MVPSSSLGKSLWLGLLNPSKSLVLIRELLADEAMSGVCRGGRRVLASSGPIQRRCWSLQDGEQ